MRTIIIGLGNEIAGDDALGILAARRLRHVFRHRRDVDVAELPWAGLHLLNVLRGYDRAVLIDSLRSEGRYRPGTIVRLTEDDFAGSVRLNSFHDLNYPTAMALGRAMDWPMPERIDVFAVEGESFLEFTTRLTEAASKGLDELVRLVAATLRHEGAPPATGPPLPARESMTLATGSPGVVTAGTR